MATDNPQGGGDTTGGPPRGPEPLGTPPKPATSPAAATPAKAPAPAPAQPNVANKAPAASTDNPFRVRRREMERQLKALDDDRSRHGAQARAHTSAMLAELKDQEARYGQSGLSPLTPRGNLLVAGQIQAQYPDDHLRWVNETIPGRTAFLSSLGYERVPGQITGGDTVLWKIPREKWASGEVAKQATTERNLRKATDRNRGEMVSDLQKFFDQHGVNIDAEKVVSREV